MSDRSGDLRGGAPEAWLVIGWFTEDAVYRPLAERLAASLDRLKAPYELVAVPRLAGGWEANVRAKAAQALAAVDRHPGKTLVLIDIDFEAKGDLSYLAHAPGDIALRISARSRRKGGARIYLSSRVVVIKPTAAARRFIEKWQELSSRPDVGYTAESYLGLAAGSVDGCAISNLDRERLYSTLSHSEASTGARMSDLKRSVVRIFQSIRRRTGSPRAYRFVRSRS
jgi:hypothetical protein